VSQCLAAGCGVDRDVAPLLGSCGYRMTIVTTHVILPATSAFDPIDAPLAMSRIPNITAPKDGRKSVDKMPHKVNEERKKVRSNRDYTALGELADPLTSLDVPSSVLVACTDLMRAADAFHFQGFFALSFPPYVVHDMCLFLYGSFIHYC